MIRLRVGPFRRGIPWAAAFEDVRWGLAAGVVYVVGAALACLLLGVAELGGTAEGMRHLPKRVPWWQPNDRP